MDAADLDLRNLTYRLFVDRGRAPTLDEAAEVAGLPADEVQRGWRRLADAHAVVLDERTDTLRMLNPFSAVPTPHRVEAGGRWWYANCAWDAFGICAALHEDGRIETSCPDCAAIITVEVADQQPSDRTLLFHCVVPASQWWDDIVFT